MPRNSGSAAAAAAAAAAGLRHGLLNLPAD